MGFTMKKEVKEVLIGFIIGLLANMAGTYLYIFFFSKLSFESTLQGALENGFLGSLIALGAIFELGRFLYFSEKNTILQSERCSFGNRDCSISYLSIKIFLKNKTAFIDNSLP